MRVAIGHNSNSKKQETPTFILAGTSQHPVDIFAGNRIENNSWSSLLAAHRTQLATQARFYQIILFIVSYQYLLDYGIQGIIDLNFLLVNTFVAILY